MIEELDGELEEHGTRELEEDIGEEDIIWEGMEEDGILEGELEEVIEAEDILWEEDIEVEDII